MQLTGRKEICILKGEIFELTLRGKQLTVQLDVGSEYTEATVSHFFFDGIGILKLRATKEIQVFEFETWKEEKYNDRTLEEFVLRFPTWKDGRFKREPEFNDDDKPRLIDALCYDINTVIRIQAFPVPAYRFDQLRRIHEKQLSV